MSIEQYEDAWNEHDLNGDFIDWNHWLRNMNTLNSEQACLLMNGLDPSVFKGQCPSANPNTVDKVLHLAHKMMAIADASPTKPEAPSEWRKWAEELGFKIHSQFLVETALPPAKTGDCAGPTNGNSFHVPLTTGQIAECFCGLRWKTTQVGKQVLGKKPSWALNAILIPGIQGKQEIRWSPVWIGFKLITTGYAKAPQIRARFKSQPLLQEWLELWKDFEADNIAEH